jgi:hypothetical protein
VKVNWSKAKLIGTSIGFALLHYAAFTVSYVRSEVIYSVADQDQWQIVLKALSFPLVYLARLSSSVDFFPIVIVANSFLWGAACAVVIARFSALRGSERVTQ